MSTGRISSSVTRFVVGGSRIPHAVMAFGPRGFSDDREDIQWRSRETYDRWRGGTGLSFADRLQVISSRMVAASGPLKVPGSRASV